MQYENIGRHVGKRKPLAMWLAALSLQTATTAISAAASGLPIVNSAVTSCDDDGSPGTLRYAVLTANDGDTVDLSAMTCSHITLQTGAINVSENNLTIVGAGAAKLTIDANQAGRAFFHGGSGTLTLDDMTISNGLRAADSALGGCVYSKGNVSLSGATVSNCTAQGPTAAAGGGVFVAYNLTLINSSLADNVADAAVGAGAELSAAGGGAFVIQRITLLDSSVSGNLAQAATGYARGGGLYVSQQFIAKYSSISGNTAAVQAFSPNNSSAFGGGVLAGFNNNLTVFTMSGCTVDHNRADAAGGLFFSGDNSHTLKIANSTISGNIANIGIGGVAAGGKLTLSNSTIAFNTAGDYGGGGLLAEGYTLDMESSIIADNSPSGSQFAADLDGGATVSGHSNLVKIAGSMVSLPSDTIRLDPQLDVLQDNGGRTRTHALLSGSPAIDAGNNAANLSTDQRSTNFPRVIGAKADIGAFEFNSDIIFINGFN
jgi:hypothetical protein